MVWAIYAADYLVRLAITERRREFVRRNVIDLIAVALPVLRPLRLVRVLLVFDIVQHQVKTGFRGSVVSQVAVLVALLSALGSLSSCLCALI